MSTERALKVLAKYMMKKSVIKSKRIIGTSIVELVTGTVNFPNMTTLAD